MRRLQVAISLMLALGLLVFHSPSMNAATAQESTPSSGQRDGASKPKSAQKKQPEKQPPEKKQPVEKKQPPEKKQSDFLRIRRDEQDEPLAMETAVIRYRPQANATGPRHVDLIGAVHVGEKSYYEQLNRRFETYDALLYELVAPEDANVPRPGEGKRGDSAVSMLQRGMKSMLGLEFQLECVDYTPRNFVHADMSPEEFAKSMRDRGESFLQMFFRMMGQSVAMQAKGSGGPSDAELLFALLSKDRALKMKRIMAEQFEDLEGATSILEGPNGSTIITERNKKALSVLRRELTNGKQRIGIFYGAGHLPDLDRRLIAEFGMERVETTWLTAWDLAGQQRD